MIYFTERSSLSDKEILCLYRNILMYLELTEQSRKYNVKSRSLQTYLKAKRISLLGRDKIASLEKEDFFSRPGGEFCFSVGNESQVASLLRHLRNAIAHCNISKQKISHKWHYCFLDKDRGKITMLGKLPHRLLEEFIQALKSSETQTKPANTTKR